MYEVAGLVFFFRGGGDLSFHFPLHLSCTVLVDIYPRRIHLQPKMSSSDKKLSTNSLFVQRYVDQGKTVLDIQKFAHFEVTCPLVSLSGKGN